SLYEQQNESIRHVGDFLYSLHVVNTSFLLLPETLPHFQYRSIQYKPNQNSLVYYMYPMLHDFLPGPHGDPLLGVLTMSVPEMGQNGQDDRTGTCYNLFSILNRLNILNYNIYRRLKMSKLYLRDDIDQCSCSCHFSVDFNCLPEFTDNIMGLHCTVQRFGTVCDHIIRFRSFHSRSSSFQ